MDCMFRTFGASTNDTSTMAGVASAESGMIDEVGSPVRVTLRSFKRDEFELLFERQRT
jgi:hypothetical protein